MTAHSQAHGIADTIDHDPGTNNTVLGTVAGALIEKAFGTSAAGSALVERQANGNVTLPATDPLVATDGASKGYVDKQVVTGVTWKELVLSCDQLIDDPAGGLSQAILIALAANLTVGDTFVITDGAAPETWTAVAGAPAANQFQIAGSAAATLTNLVTAIIADGTLWTAVETSTLDPYFSATPTEQAVIYRKTVPTGVADDRIHGAISGGQADLRVVEFASGLQDYRESSGTETDLPAVDPAAKRFGLNRDSGPVQAGDTHRCAADNSAFTWDADAAVWQNTDTGTAVTPGDGIDITGAKVATKVATATGAATQQFGALVNDRNSDASGAAAADQGFNAIKTDNASIAVDQATNALTLIGILGQFKGAGAWTSVNNGDKEPTLAEYQALLGTAGSDINNWGFLIESGGGGRTYTYLAFKKGNAGALADFQGVALS